MEICQALDISRQAYYSARRKRSQDEVDETRVLRRVQAVRASMPRLGGRKLYGLLASDLRGEHGIKVGRDKFFALLRKHGLLVKRHRKYALTTNSRHQFPYYTNLIKGMTVQASNQVFVSDITYIRLKNGFGYLAYGPGDLGVEKKDGQRKRNRNKKELKDKGACRGGYFSIRTVTEYHRFCIHAHSAPFPLR